MFPFRDHNPSERTPYVTIALIVINILVFLSYFPLFDDPWALSAFFERWALVPFLAGENPQGFVTHMFLHGGFMHLGGNMLFLWVFGDNLEDEMGHLVFLGFYLACGVGAAVFQYLADPGSLVPMVGASGAVAGVMGGYLLLYPKAKVDILVIIIIVFRVIVLPAWLMLGLWFGLQLLNGFLTAGAQAGGVAHWAHVGGFFVGLLLALPLWASLGGTQYWQLTQGHPPHPHATYRAGRTNVPRIRRK
jgi:membrane associated rhomboid family serine protease